MNKKWLDLYVAVNEMMNVLCTTGEVTARGPLVSGVMNALHELDDGVYDVEKIKRKIKK